MSSTLPPRPHPDHLRRQARELHRALKLQDPAALARAAPYRLGPQPRLTAAQLVIARELGFASWPLLMEAVEAQRVAALSDADFVKQVLLLAYGQGWTAPQPRRALALAKTRRVDSLALSLALGDLPAVQAALNGADLTRPLPPFGAPALAAVVFSSLARLDECRAGHIATVHWLLAQGADANARWAPAAHPDQALPMLYGAVARAACFETVQALLQAGADPNDNESLYHATEQTDRRILAAVVQAGARWHGTNALFRQLDHDRLDDLRQALELGADVNESGPHGARPLHHAIVRGRTRPFVQLLVEHGADPADVDGHGRTPAELAAHTGDADTVAYLAGLGHVARLDEQARFLAACAAGDGDVARAHLAAHPAALRQLGSHALRLLPDQAQRGRHAAVQLMLELGWPVDVRGDWDASALNQAAFRGDAALVRMLLAHGAHWHEPNGFGGNALGSCLHAGTNEPLPDGDYPEVLKLLLADGAPAPQQVDHLPEAMQAVLADAA
jgi:ankyrin repeat protein